MFRLIEPDFIIAYEAAMSVSDTNLNNGEKPISEITDAVSNLLFVYNRFIHIIHVYSVIFNGM